MPAVDRSRIVALDKAHVWHPYTAMGPYVRNASPLCIRRAEGSTLEDVDGRRLIDGNSSWWVASLGHGHPRLLRALVEQAEELAHCSLAGTTHAPAALLAEALVRVAPEGLTRVFYSDDGSTAVEVAIKMALQYWQLEKQPRRTRFVALDGAFHGDTIGASSLGGVELFKRPFAGVLFDCIRAPLEGLDPYAQAFDTISQLVTEHSDEVAAIVVEPLVQGAAGMRMYAPEALRLLRELADRTGALLVFDEVFTGYGRTGTMWASEHAGVAPDIMCIGKTFASILPMAATLASERVFAPFTASDDAALHYGHTFCGNPLGARLALEVLAIVRDEKLVERSARLGEHIRSAFDTLAKLDGVRSTRTLGMIGAADLAPESGSGYTDRIGWRVYERALELGAYLRPLGSTVYVTPPLTISETDLDRLLEILAEAVRDALVARSSG